MNFITKLTKIGIPVYLLPIENANTVASGVLINTGSRDEKIPNEAGLAHACEHMALHGTEKFPSKQLFSEYIEEVGGYRNALTSKEIIFFYNQVPYLEIERSMESLSELIQYPLIPEDKISTEINVILQELVRANDTPERFLQETTYEKIFGNHPIAHSIFGTKESLLNLKRETILNFINNYYHSNNYKFIIAGRFDIDETIELLDKYFSVKSEKESNIRMPQKIQEIEISQKLNQEVIIPYKTNQPHINIIAPIFLANIKEKICLNLFSVMIGGGTSSPLFEEIRNKKGLAYKVFCGYYLGTDAGIFRIYMDSKSDKYEEAIDIAFSIMEKTKNDQMRLEKVKKMKIGSLALKFENPIDIIQNAAYEINFFGKPYGYNETVEAIENITIQDIENAVDKYLKKEQFATLILMPEKNKSPII